VEPIIYSVKDDAQVENEIRRVMTYIAQRIRDAVDPVLDIDVESKCGITIRVYRDEKLGAIVLECNGGVTVKDCGPALSFNRDLGKSIKQALDKGEFLWEGEDTTIELSIPGHETVKTTGRGLARAARAMEEQSAAL